MIAAGGRQLDTIFVDSVINVWQYHVDWKDPSKTTVTGPVAIAVAPYHYLCDGQISNCVPQPGTDRRLDSQGDKIMQPLVYRNVHGRESIVAVHSVNTVANGGGVRWYELRMGKNRNVTLYQQGTYAPDGYYRWEPSAAMDRNGDIGIAYSFGGTTNFPGQRFAGRLEERPAGAADAARGGPRRGRKARKRAPSAGRTMCRQRSTRATTARSGMSATT